MAEDLANRHERVTDLFPDPTDPGVYERYALTDEQLAFYEANGYVAGIPLLDGRQLEALRAELAGFFDSDHDGRELWYEYHSNESGDPDAVLFHSLGAWRIGKAFHDLLWHPAFLVPASQLLGGSVRFWHDQLFCKPANHGGVVAWHQDYSYWTRTAPMAHLTCWIGLDDSTTENGCLHYVPGSHRWPLMERTELANNMDAVREQLTPEQQAQFNPVPVELEAGSATFHHPLLVHGSYPNRSGHARRATVLNVIRDGVKSETEEPLLEGMNPVPKGEPLGGTCFPLLYPVTSEERVA